MDGDLQNFMCIHGLGGERFVVMSYALYPYPKNAYFFVICCLYTRSQMFFSQTPGRRPPYITGLRETSETLGWVGAPNERAPLRVHDAIAVFFARCLTRTRIADQGLGGGSRTLRWLRPRKNRFRVSCPGEFKICRSFSSADTFPYGSETRKAPNSV